MSVGGTGGALPVPMKTLSKLLFVLPILVACSGADDLEGTDEGAATQAPSNAEFANYAFVNAIITKNPADVAVLYDAMEKQLASGATEKVDDTRLYIGIKGARGADPYSKDGIGIVCQKGRECDLVSAVVRIDPQADEIMPGVAEDSERRANAITLAGALADAVAAGLPELPKASPTATVQRGAGNVMCTKFPDEFNCTVLAKSDTLGQSFARIVEQLKAHAPAEAESTQRSLTRLLDKGFPRRRR